MTAAPDLAQTVEAAQTWLAAVRARDAAALWDTFSTAARRFIVARGVRRGMSEAFGAELMAGTADGRERDHFLADLLAGIEKDLEHIDLERIVVSTEPETLAEGHARVALSQEFVVPVGPPVDPLPVGSLLLVVESVAWKVDKLVPRPG